MTLPVKIVAVTGPTATGKTRLAVHLARRFTGEIVSADSRQVYRALDLGSGKDLEEYGEIPCHLLDVAEPEETYDLARFLNQAHRAIADISSRGKLPVICGGTPLYLNALLGKLPLTGGPPDPDRRRELNGMTIETLQNLLTLRHPEAWEQLNADDRVNPRRLRRACERAESPVRSAPEYPRCDALVLGVLYPRGEVRSRIESRLDSRLESGMIQEVESLLERLGLERLEALGLEYREIGRYCAGLCDFSTMRTALLNRIRQFAKHQDGFFRKLEREGTPIYWLERGDRAAAESLIERFLRGEELPAPGFSLASFINPRRSTEATK